MSGDNSVPIPPHLICSWLFCLLRFNLQFKKVIISRFFCSKSSLLHGRFETFYSPFYSLQKHFKTRREGIELSQTFTEFFFFVLQASQVHSSHTQQTFVNTESINSNELFSPPVHCGPDLLVLCILLISKTTCGSGQLTISFYMKQANAKPTDNSCNISLAAEERISQITLDLYVKCCAG